MYIGTQPAIGQNRKLDSIAASFNGVLTTFNLTVNTASIVPSNVYQLFISLGGVLQNPGVDFTANGNQITFTTAPTAGLSFFGIFQGDSITGTPTIADASITTAKLATGLTVTYTAGTAAAPSVTFAGDLANGAFAPAANTFGITTGGTERLRIASSGRVGIGTTSPATLLNCYGGVSGTDTRITVNNAAAAVQVGIDASNDAVLATNISNSIIFSTNSQERMRIGNDGWIYASTTSKILYTFAAGNGLTWSGAELGIATTADSGMYINRTTTDGDLIRFYQGGTQEGTISVSGTTVTYGGGHLARWSQLPNNEDPSQLLKGTIMSNLEEMCDWSEEDNEQLNKTKISDVEGDKNVAGVFVSTSFNEEGPQDFFVAMTGDMVIRIAEDITVERGDLLMSAGDGTAKPQDDDIIRSKTIAKVTSTNVSCIYADGSYCVPCVLMAC